MTLRLARSEQQRSGMDDYQVAYALRPVLQACIELNELCQNIASHGGGPDYDGDVTMSDAYASARGPAQSEQNRDAILEDPLTALLDLIASNFRRSS